MKQRKAAPVAKAEAVAPKSAGSGWHSGLPPGIFIFLAVTVFYFWTATSSAYSFNWTAKKSDHYNLLADGFLKGHLYLSVDPSPEMLALKDPYDPVANFNYRLHDASLYKGHYYVYFGPVPVLTLNLPWKLLTGLYIPNNFAAILYCLAGYIFSCLLVFTLLDAYGVKPSWLQKRLIVAALGLCQTTPIILRRAYMYETAVAAGFCFALAGLYFLARYVLAAEPRKLHAVLAGLFLGFTPGCRPNYVVFVAAVGGFYLWYLVRSRALKRPDLMRELYRFGTPIAACALALLWYNYARFGNPFNIGQVYQLIGYLPDRGVTMKLSNLLPGVYKLLIQFPVWVRHFPWVELSTAGNFGAEQWPPGFDHIEALTGLLPTSPLCILGLALPVFLWRWRSTVSEPLRMILLAIYAAAVINLIAVVMTVNQVTQRYEMDFAPELLVLSLFVVLVLVARTANRTRRIGLEVAFGVIVAATAIMQACLSINGYDNQLMQRNVPAFTDIASFFGDDTNTLRRYTYGLGLSGSITFQNEPAGRREALFTTGVPRRSNCVFVEYQGGGRVRFAAHMSGPGIAYGPPVAIQPGATYPFELTYNAGTGALRIRMADVTPLATTTFFFPTAYADATALRNEVGVPVNVQPFTGILNADLGLQFGAAVDK